MTTASTVEALPDKGPMFFIRYAYYLLKTAREVFIFSQGGAGSSSSGCGQAQL